MASAQVLDPKANNYEAEAGFGESTYGKRLDYADVQYKDLWALVLFYVHVIVILVVGVILIAQSGGSKDDGTSGSSESVNFAGFFAGLAVSAVVSGLFAILWIKMIQLYSELIIKILLVLVIGIWLFVALVGVFGGATGLVIISILVAAAASLYTWCIWTRIPFAGACLSISSKVSQMYPGTIGYSFLAVLKNTVWVVIWVLAYVAYAFDTDSQNSVFTFLLLVSLYWGVQVWSNVSHTTTCGVTATWYFNPGTLMNPSRGAYKRTMTTSFGSVAFGSLLVGILQAARAMIKGSGGAGCARCILMCIERIMRYFNKYAFAQVAIYGTSFYQSAKATWDLFVNRGISALVNDDLSGLALSCGAVLGAVASCLVGYFVTRACYDEDDSDRDSLAISCAVVAFILGFYIVSIALLAVASGVIALFVCFAEDPVACASNRPEEYEKLTGVSEPMKQMATAAGAPVAGEPGQQQPI